jgi:hypothetical protein
MEFVACPSCGAPAEVEDWAELPSTHGALAHVRTFCVRRHWHLLPRDTIAPPVAPAAIHRGGADRSPGQDPPGARHRAGS